MMQVLNKKKSFFSATLPTPTTPILFKLLKINQLNKIKQKQPKTLIINNIINSV